MEYTFADGTQVLLRRPLHERRQGIYSSYVHGTKGMAIAARANDCSGPSAIYKGQNADAANLVWQSNDNTQSLPERVGHLIDAIRKNKPYNEVKRGVEASLVTSMGRMAAHTGQEITSTSMLNCEHEFAPGLDKLTADSPAPLQPGPNGRYPAAQAGDKPDREY